IGDFETDKMKEVVAKILGKAKADQPVIDSTQTNNIINNYKEAESEAKDYSLTGQTIIDTTANVKSTYINFSFNAPHFTDSAYLPMDLLSKYLAMDDISPLKTALKSGATPLADEVSVSLETYEEFSRFEISVITSNADNRDQIIDIILNQVKNISKYNAGNEVIEGIKISTKTSEIYYSDKLHYYAFIIAPMMMTAGWDYIQEYPELINTVNWEDCKKVAEIWLDNPNYIATVVKPNPEGVEGFTPRSLAVEEVTSHFDSVKFDKYNLIDKEKINYPQTDSVNFELVEKAEYHRETLHNGLTVIVKSHPDSRVFALNVLGKDRTANEPDGKGGITDFMNRCIEKGTVTRNSFELTRDLSKIGANITLYDNPWIPFDDRYTTRQYSFMKFETIDDFAEKGFHLFTEMILYPSFDSIEVENVRQQMMGVLGRNSVSPRKVARNLFYSTLFDNLSFARPIMGTMRSVGSITAEDLKDYHAKFYSPENMIISIVSNKPISEVMSMVNRRFGSLVPSGFTGNVAQEPEPLFEIKSAHSDLDKEQISIYLGGILPGASSEDAPALTIANSILSSRLYLNLREKDGLAYSVGAGARFDKDFGWYYSVIGTGYENYQKAVDGILLQIDKLKYDGPEIQEINKARNQIWGRLMRAKLSNINQAYYLCCDEYLGRPAPYDNHFIKELSQIDINKIQQVFAKYYKTDAYVISSAGKIE
ncbi:MAG: insulinase family protein, partial [candidate division Zixibacteria bacterium]|nr:insulinase family protein [candidate division Zixibacteria bacterium]